MPEAGVKKSRTKRQGPGSKPAPLAIDHAIVLAAGLGTRMRPLTDTLPKPLIKVGGRALIDHTLDRLVNNGVKTAVVNLHHLAPKVEAHLKKRTSPKIVFSREPDILDTGGGIVNALPLLGDAPFFAANGDILWLNGPRSALRRMVEAWDDEKMDGLLLMHNTVDAYGYTGMGDFTLDPDGLLGLRPERELSPFLYTGVQILHPRLFKDVPDGPFPLNILYERAIEAERLYGIVHDGEWFHIGTPEGLTEAEAYMTERYAGKKRR